MNNNKSYWALYFFTWTIGYLLLVVITDFRKYELDFFEKGEVFSFWSTLFTFVVLIIVVTFLYIILSPFGVTRSLLNLLDKFIDKYDSDLINYLLEHLKSNHRGLNLEAYLIGLLIYIFHGLFYFRASQKFKRWVCYVVLIVLIMAGFYGCKDVANDVNHTLQEIKFYK